jgi:hypothetical protein
MLAYLAPKKLHLAIPKCSSLFFAAHCAQTQNKRYFEDGAKQHFQNTYCDSIDK